MAAPSKRALEAARARAAKEAAFAGTRFGSLVALYPLVRTYQHLGGWWLFKCDCGEEKELEYRAFKLGLVKSCGCARRANSGSFKAEDLTGRRFGRLTAKRLHNKRAPLRWLCDCDCGRETIAAARDLKRAGKRSCGCLRRG